MLTRALLVPVLAAALLAAAVPAAWADTAQTAEAVDQTQVEHIVEHLRQDPVFISDHITRAFPPDDRTRIRRILGRAGVPTYYLALPMIDVEPRGQDLLAVVHDRIGADGLYISTDETGIWLEAQAWGHDLPTDAALRATTFELPADAGPIGNLERFMEVLTSDNAEERAQAAADADAAGGSPLSRDEDRSDIASSIGSLISGIPVFVLCAALYVRRVRRRLRADPGAAR